MDILHSAGDALWLILDVHRLGFLFLGVVMGLCLGILPGIGGVAGTALLLPFTYSLDASTAMALCKSCLLSSAAPRPGARPSRRFISALSIAEASSASRAETSFVSMRTPSRSCA